jgi:hypothetical protein
MADFYRNLAHDKALEIEALSRLAYELREHRNAVLAQYGASDEADLLGQISSGALAEHPAYEHYLAARVLEQTRDSARALMAEKLAEAARP